SCRNLTTSSSKPLPFLFAFVTSACAQPSPTRGCAAIRSSNWIDVAGLARFRHAAASGALGEFGPPSRRACAHRRAQVSAAQVRRLGSAIVYTPQHFEEKRPDVLARAIRDIQFALLVTAADGKYLASHLPMVLKEANGAFTLEAHVARPNEHWRALGSRPASLAVFQGPHTYVSPSWYESKRQHGKVVPTWNYVVVHAHG